MNYPYKFTIKKKENIKIEESAANELNRQTLTTFSCSEATRRK